MELGSLGVGVCIVNLANVLEALWGKFETCIALGDCLNYSSSFWHALNGVVTDRSFSWSNLNSYLRDSVGCNAIGE